MLAGQIDAQQSILQRGSSHFDAIGEHKAAQKLSRCDAAMKERFAVNLSLASTDHQLAVFFGDAELVLGEARHGQGDADSTVLQALL